MSNGHPIPSYLLFGLSAVFAGLGALGAGQELMAVLPGPPPVVVPFVFWQFAVWSFLLGHFMLRRHARRRAERRTREERLARGQGARS